jgi:hypothetical protein
MITVVAAMAESNGWDHFYCPIIPIVVPDHFRQFVPAMIQNSVSRVQLQVGSRLYVSCEHFESKA